MRVELDLADALVAEEVLQRCSASVAERRERVVVADLADALHNLGPGQRLDIRLGSVYADHWETHVFNLQQVRVKSVHVDEPGYARDEADQLDHEERGDDDEEENVRHRLARKTLRDKHVVKAPSRVRKPPEARVVDA